MSAAVLPLLTPLMVAALFKRASTGETRLERELALSVLQEEFRRLTKQCQTSVLQSENSQQETSR